jgi:AraC family transcriptional regulator
VDDAIQISLVLRGELTERVGRQEERGAALSLVVKARGVEHANQYGPEGAVLFRLALGGNAGEALLDPAARLPAWQWQHGAGPLRPMLRLADRLGGRAAALPGDDPDVLAVLAAVTGGAPSVGTRGVAPAWLRQVRQRLDEEPAARVGLVAADAGVHPVYLARCFRRWFGCSVAACLQRSRLRRAAGLMADSGWTLGRIAHQAGFTDQAHLNRRFREATGMTPGHYQAGARSALAMDCRVRQV